MDYVGHAVVLTEWFLVALTWAFLLFPWGRLSAKNQIRSGKEQGETTIGDADPD